MAPTVPLWVPIQPMATGEPSPPRAGAAAEPGAGVPGAGVPGAGLPALAGFRLAGADWLRARDAYRSRMRPWVESRLRRRSRHDQHPVHDFLFEYYSFRPAQLT